LVKRYSQFVRVTRNGWEVLPGYEWSKKLEVWVEYKNYEFHNDPDILRGIRDSFKKANQLCHWCKVFMDTGFDTCLFCGNRRLKVVPL